MRNKIEWKPSPEYSKNADRYKGNEQSCILCGRPIKDASKVKWVHMIDGGRHLLRNGVEYNENDPGEMGCFPIGNSCLKNHPELKDFVQ